VWKTTIRCPSLSTHVFSDNKDINASFLNFFLPSITQPLESYTDAWWGNLNNKIVVQYYQNVRQANKLFSNNMHTVQQISSWINEVSFYVVTTFYRFFLSNYLHRCLRHNISKKFETFKTSPRFLHIQVQTCWLVQLRFQNFVCCCYVFKY